MNDRTAITDLSSQLFYILLKALFQRVALILYSLLYYLIRGQVSVLDSGATLKPGHLITESFC